ncbi:unnamed protein product, partial [marine sediment metagenome]
IILSFDLPKAISYIGTVDFWTVAHPNEFIKKDKTEEVFHNGIPYIRHRITLDKETIINRLIKNNYYYIIHTWIRPPQDTNAVIYWKLMKGEETLVETTTKIKTVGRIENVSLPEKFILFLWYMDDGLTDEIVDERISLYKKMGITHFSKNYGPSGWSGRTRLYLEKLRNSGLKIIPQRGGSFGSEQAPLAKLNKNQGKGLYSASKKTCQGMLSPENKKDFSRIAELVDGVVWDYEPFYGPGKYPGYDDDETIKAFCREKGIKGELSSED